MNAEDLLAGSSINTALEALTIGRVGVDLYPEQSGVPRGDSSAVPIDRRRRLWNNGFRRAQGA